MQSDGQTDSTMVQCAPMDATEGIKTQLGALLDDVRLAKQAGHAWLPQVEVLLQQALGVMSIGPGDFGKVLQAARAAAGLSQVRVAKLAGVSERTLKNIEQGKVVPRADTITRLYGVPALRLSEILSVNAEMPQQGWRPNSWFAPRYQSALLLRDMVDLVNGPGGTLEQTALYLDSRSAMDYLELCNSAPLYQAFRRAVPFDKVAAICAKQLRDATAIVVNGLGSGDGTAESGFVRELAALTPARIKLQVLDISHTLLSVAHHTAAQALEPAGVEVLSLHANFHDLARYKVLHGDPEGDPRVYLLLGSTIANVENEVRFFNELASVAAPGDLLVVDCQPARAPANKPDEIRKAETQLTQGPAATHFDWLTGPIRRHCRDAKDVKLSIELSTQCVVPGSYELDFYVTATMNSGQTRKYLVLRAKRYEPAELCAFLKSAGWSTVETLRFEGGAILVLRRS